MEAQTQPSQPTSSRLSEAKRELFSVFDDELARQVGEARSQVSTSLIAEIELLREQLRDMQDQVEEHKQALEQSERRADTAEFELKQALETAENAKAESEAELKRVGEAGALVSSELLATSEAAEKVREENKALTEQLQLEQQRREATDEKLKLANERSERAEEELLNAVAQGALEKDSLSVAARVREEALFARLVEVQAQTQATLDAARLPK